MITLVAGSMIATSARAVPVVGWQCDMTTGNCDDDAQLSIPGTPNPKFGDGTPITADDFAIWGATPSNVHLDPNFEAITSTAGSPLYWCQSGQRARFSLGDVE